MTTPQERRDSRERAIASFLAIVLGVVAAGAFLNWAWYDPAAAREKAQQERRERIDSWVEDQMKESTGQ